MRLTNQNEDTMVAWIQNSTLSIGIDASHGSFQLYQSGKTETRSLLSIRYIFLGIYSDSSCSKVIDHMVCSLIITIDCQLSELCVIRSLFLIDAIGWLWKDRLGRTLLDM